MEAQQYEEAESTLKSNVTWMPMAREQAVPLAALSVCSVNLNRNCDFHVQRKFEAYLDNWKHPAPDHCQPSGKGRPPVAIVHADRLGLDIEDCTK